jgi:hypothetical protein
MKERRNVAPHVLQSYYYSVFGGDEGQVVLNDIKLLLTGAGLDDYEGVDPLLPQNELASKTATRNAWDMIDGMTQGIVVKKKGFWWFIKETYRIYKRSRGSK